MNATKIECGVRPIANYGAPCTVGCEHITEVLEFEFFLEQVFRVAI